MTISRVLATRDTRTQTRFSPLLAAVVHLVVFIPKVQAKNRGSLREPTTIRGVLPLSSSSSCSSLLSNTRMPAKRRTNGPKAIRHRAFVPLASCRTSVRRVRVRVGKAAEDALVHRRQDLLGHRRQPRTLGRERRVEVSRVQGVVERRLERRLQLSPLQPVPRQVLRDRKSIIFNALAFILATRDGVVCCRRTRSRRILPERRRA